MPAEPTSPTIIWMSHEAFWDTARDVTPLVRTDDDWLAFTISLPELTARIPIPPVDTPINEGDFPGPVSRWYGHVAGFRFLLTYHHVSPAKEKLLVEFAPVAGARETIERAFRTFIGSQPLRETGQSLVRRDGGN